jgi:hypothetical protein
MSITKPPPSNHLQSSSTLMLQLWHVPTRRQQNCYFNITNADTHFSSAGTGRNQIRARRCDGSLFGPITHRGDKVTVELNLLAVDSFSVCLQFLKSRLWTSNIMLRFQELGIWICIIQLRRTEYTRLPQEQWLMKSPARNAEALVSVEYLQITTKSGMIY